MFDEREHAAAARGDTAIDIAAAAGGAHLDRDQHAAALARGLGAVFAPSLEVTQTWAIPRDVQPLGHRAATEDAAES